MASFAIPEHESRCQTMTRALIPNPEAGEGDSEAPWAHFHVTLDDDEPTPYSEAQGVAMKTACFLVCLAVPIAAATQPEAGPEPIEFPQRQSATGLLRACASSPLTAVGRERRRYCAGFVSGVEEAMRLFKRTGGLPVSACPPQQVTAQSLAQSYIDYVAKHPEELGKSAGEVAVNALSLACPCGPSSPPPMQ
jgi:hypothetical protein